MKITIPLGLLFLLSVQAGVTADIVVTDNITATNNVAASIHNASAFYLNPNSKNMINLGLGVDNGHSYGFLELQKVFSKHLSLRLGGQAFINSPTYTNGYYLKADNPLYYDEANQITIRGLYTLGSIGFKSNVKDDLRGIYLRSNFLFKKKLDHMDLLAGIGVPLFTSMSDSDYKMRGPITKGQGYIGVDYHIFNTVGIVLIASTETIYYGFSINNFPFIFYQDSEHRTVFGLGMPVF